jgi:hypothetical protein
MTIRVEGMSQPGIPRACWLSMNQAVPPAYRAWAMTDRAMMRSLS